MRNEMRNEMSNGTLTQVPSEIEGTPDAYYFEHKPGEYRNIKFDSPEQAKATPINIKIALRMSGKEDKYGFYAVPAVKNHFSAIESPATKSVDMIASADLSKPDKIKFHVGIFRQVRVGESATTIDRELRKIIRRAEVVALHFKTTFGHIWDVDVRGYLMEGNESCFPPIFAQNNIKSYVASHPEEFTDFRPNYWMAAGGYSKYYCGQANLGGKRSAVYADNYVCGVGPMIHELGHNRGQHHSSTANTDGSITEYGDKSFLMGSSHDSRKWASPHLVAMGAPDSSGIHTSVDTEQVLVTDSDLNFESLHKNEYQHVIINTRPYETYVSYGEEARVILHTLTGDNHTVRQLPDLRYPGDSKTLENGVVIEYVAYDVGQNMAAVNVIHPSNTKKPADIEIPQGFPLNSGTTLTEEHSGPLFNRDFNGQGLDVHMRDGRILIHWFTFNINNDSTRFYNAAGSLDDNRNGLDLYTTEDGTREDPTKHSKMHAGRCQLVLDDRGWLFHWNTPEHGRGSVRLERLLQPNSNPNNGSYYLKSREGEGLSVQFYDLPEGKQGCAAWFYSYGPTPRGSLTKNPPTGNTKQRWYSLEGFEQPDGTFNLQIYEVYDHSWMRLDDESGATKVGTATVELIDADNIKFNFDLKTPTVEDAAIRELARLF